MDKRLLTDINAPLTDVQRQLMADNVKLIRWYVGKYGHRYPALNSEDLVDICTDAYVRAIQNYNPSKGKVAPYVTSYMWGKLGNYFARKKEKYILLNDIGAEPGTWVNLVGSEQMVSEKLIDDDAYQLIDSFVDYGLTPREIEALKWYYYYDGCRDRRNLAGEQMGVTGTMVDSHGRSAKKKLKPYKEVIKLAISG